MLRVPCVILILVTTLHGVRLHGMNVAMFTQMEEALDQICPQSSICEDSDDFSSDSRSCCKGCSCLPNCDRIDRCCFPNTSRNQTHSIRIQCVLAMPSKVDTADRFYHIPSFRMVTSVTKYSQSDSTLHNNCGDKIVAPWGSLYPVYSKRADQIFKNRACAEEYNVTDGEMWETFISCEENILTDGASYVSGLLNNIFPNECKIYFIYQGSSRLDSHVCYRHVDKDDTCFYTNFDIPAELAQANVSGEDIKKMCKSGLFAPYVTAARVFKNAFCSICNKQYASNRCKQSEAEYDGFKFAPYSSFTGLLDRRFLQTMVDSRNNEYHKTSQLACIPSMDNTSEVSSCRVIHCPSGQLMHEDGTCFFPAKLWHSNQFSLMLNLTTDTPFNVSKVFQMNADRKASNIDMLHSTWPKEWIRYFLCEESVVSERPSFMLRMVRIKDEHFMPKYFFAEIAELMKSGRWSLTYGNKTIALKANYFHFRKVAGSNVEGNKYELIFNKQVASSTYRIMYLEKNDDVRRKIFPLTKLYFCNQIELLPGEFFLDNEHRILINRIKNTILYDGQFTMIHTSLGSVPRVCIEDSGFIANSSSRGYSIETLLAVKIIWILTKFIFNFSNFDN
ncbi:hypothetical protein ACF0H5_013633 [Mactra antiquata]